MNKVIIIMRATDPATRKKVVDLYLQGVGRNESARILGIGETTVTDIIHAWKRRIENQNQSLDEYESVRDLAITCKKNGIPYQVQTGTLKPKHTTTISLQKASLDSDYPAQHVQYLLLKQ